MSKQTNAESRYAAFLPKGIGDSIPYLNWRWIDAGRGNMVPTKTSTNRWRTSTGHSIGCARGAALTRNYSM
jgi:hypothetical protein